VPFLGCAKLPSDIIPSLVVVLPMPLHYQEVINKNSPRNFDLKKQIASLILISTSASSNCSVSLIQKLNTWIRKEEDTDIL